MTSEPAQKGDAETDLGHADDAVSDEVLFRLAQTVDRRGKLLRLICPFLDKVVLAEEHLVRHHVVPERQSPRLQGDLQEPELLLNVLHMEHGLPQPRHEIGLNIGSLEKAMDFLPRSVPGKLIMQDIVLEDHCAECD